MNKHELEDVLREYVFGNIDFYVRWSRTLSAFYRYGICELGEEIR